MSKLYEHKEHQHIPKNINAEHKAEQQASGINQRIAIALTKAVGTMTCAYCFTLLAIAGFPYLLGPGVSQYVQWISQTFIQLTMLSVIMVGQAILGRKAELQADEAFSTTQKSFADIEQIVKHLDVQDSKIIEITQGQSKQTLILMAQNEELSKQTTMLIKLLQKNNIKQ